MATWTTQRYAAALRRAGIALALTLGLAGVAQAATVTITITPGSPAGTSYRIEKQINGGGYSALVTQSGLSYVDSAVSSPNTYDYRAVAITAGGESAPSAACTSALIVPGTPSVTCTINP